MLMQTDITFAGCRIWLDGETKRELTSVTGQLERWVFNFIGDPPKFNTIKNPKPIKVKKPKPPKPLTTKEVIDWGVKRTKVKPVHEIQT